MPILIAITGGSGSGKSTLAEALVSALPAGTAVLLREDSYYRDAASLPDFDAAIQADGPLLIDLHVDPRQEFSPRIKSRVDQEGRFVTPELDDMHPFLDPAELGAVRQSAAMVRALPCR